MHRNNGGFLGSYRKWFKSIGLYGQKWRWHLKVGKFDRSTVVNFWEGLNKWFFNYSDGSVEYQALEQSTG